MLDQGEACACIGIEYFIDNCSCICNACQMLGIGDWFRGIFSFFDNKYIFLIIIICTFIGITYSFIYIIERRDLGWREDTDFKGGTEQKQDIDDWDRGNSCDLFESDLSKEKSESTVASDHCQNAYQKHEQSFSFGEIEWNTLRCGDKWRYSHQQDADDQRETYYRCCMP